jgi:hypothetical protein
MDCVGRKFLMVPILCFFQYPDFVQDTALARQLYWHKESEERRKLLMPFFWNVLAAKGQLYGNREKQEQGECKEHL